MASQDMFELWALLRYKNPGSRRSASRRLYRDLDVLPKQQQEAHQPFERKPGQSPAHQGRDFWLVYAQQLRRLDLCKSLFPNQYGDLVRKLGFGKCLFRIW